jgi:hypothetical protein
MSTIKLDHIELLVGSSNYDAWRRGISQVLQGEGYWGHVEGDTDIFSAFPLEPTPAVPTSLSTADEITEFREWWKADSKTRTIVERRITPVILALLPQGVQVTARSVWETLKGLYSRHDVLSQFELRDRLANAKLKDHLDLDRYIGEFKTGRLRLLEMGLAYTEYDMVHSIIRGLPTSGSWPHFAMLVTQNTQDFIDSQSHAVVPAAPDTLLTRVISRLVVECQRIESSKPAGKSGAGSEYCNLAGPVIHKHEKNPDGVLCTVCGKKSHDAAHCFAKGGGMEGQGPKQQKAGKGKVKAPELAAAASTSSAPSALPPEAYIGDLSCAVSDEPSGDFSTEGYAGLLNSSFGSILDSGTSSHLLKDRDVFWTYEATQARSMRTANHGVLQTKASGDCLVRFTLKGVVTTVKLRDCLHAPSACINLLSVGRMTAVGSKVACSMEDGKFTIARKNPDGSREHIYEGVQSNNLYFVDLEFVYPPGRRTPESVFFTKVVETMDLWHHRMGHIGEDATKSLLRSVKGVSFPPGDRLSKCEPCIIGKHARTPHPSSTTHSATALLELVHCDLCGPFPVLTPHGKLYLIAFLEDSGNILKLHCLARKDQSADAFHVTRANWERKTGKRVLRFRVDGAGELGSDEFVKALEGMGIERDVTPRYEHWKNGKMERVFRTIQGRMLAMLTAAQLPLTYWGEAALTAGFLFNLSVSSSLPKDVTPFEVLKNTKPDVSYLKVWGVRCFAHIPVELQTKLGAKSCECLFMGYPPSG